MNYKLTGEKKTVDNVTLHRIQAIRDFGNVKSGDLGGWIEKESNLSHNGEAWVYGDACVSGNAWICGNAKVSGNAWVCDEALVSDEAKVSGKAHVSDEAKVSGNAWICGKAKVYDEAKVSGNACVSGKAWICGKALVSGNACVYGNANIMYGNYTTSVSSYKTGWYYYMTPNYPNKIAVGCELFEIPTEEEALTIMAGRNVPEEARPSMLEALEKCKQWLVDNPEKKVKETEK